MKTISVIFCEDTRVAKQFLIEQGIWTQQKLIRMDQFQEKKSFSRFDEFIEQHDVAYITDAGSPAVSDPGALLVDYARDLNINVKVLGGISAITVFLSGAGILMNEFAFGGFFPRKDGDINHALSLVVKSKSVQIWFESPKRILLSLLKISTSYPDLKWWLQRNCRSLMNYLFEERPLMFTSNCRTLIVVANGSF